MGIKLKRKEVSSRVDPDIYKAVIAGVSPQENTKFGPTLVWKFKIKDPVLDGEMLDGDVFLYGMTGQVWNGSPKANLTKLLRALDIDGTEGDELDVDELIGRPLRLVIKDNVKDDVTYSKVDDYMKLTKKKPVVQEEEAEEADEDEAPPQAKKVAAKKSVIKKPEPEEEEEEEKEAPKKAAKTDDDEELYDFDD